MVTRAQLFTAVTIAGVVGGIVACSAENATVATLASSEPVRAASGGATSGGGFDFAALTSSATCTAGGSALQPLVLPANLGQSIVASEPDFADAIRASAPSATTTPAASGANRRTWSRTRSPDPR